MRKLPILYLCFFCFEAFSIGNDGSKAWNASDFYCGDPCSKNLRTYVYLCRKTAGSDNKCYNSDEYNGLSVSFITTDGEFCGFDPNETKNIVWSASTRFGRGSSDKGIFDIQYVYNYEKYKNSGEKLREYDDGTGLPDSDRYLHNSDGSPCVSVKVSDCYAGGSELRIIKTLKSALFRWEIPGKKLSDILEITGKLGEIKDVNGVNMRVIPEYRLVGSDEFVDWYASDGNPKDSCATFSARILSRVMGLRIPKGEVKTNLGAAKLGGGVTVTAAVAAAGAFALIPVPILGPIIGAGCALIGGVGAIGTAGCLVDAKRQGYLNTPNGIINSLLKLYGNDEDFIDELDEEDDEAPENWFGATDRDIEDDKNVQCFTYRGIEVRYIPFLETYGNSKEQFRIVAHDFNESKKHYNNKRLDTYKDFVLKSIEDAINCKLEMGKQKGSRKGAEKKEERAFLNNIFLKSDFDETDDGL